MVTRKSPEEIEVMAAAGRVLAEVHRVLADSIRPGLRTADLDALAEQEIRARGARPAFKGFDGYPASINTSVNDQIVHGIPSPAVVLQSGDVLSVDAGVSLGGYCADAACTWIVGGEQAVDPAVAELVRRTREAMWAGIAELRVGRRLGDVSAAIGGYGLRHGYGVIADHDGRSLGGHGIGRHLHEDPLVANTGRPGRGMRLKPGLVFAIEPMFTQHGTAWHTLDDGWTVVSSDGAVAAHWEHTVAVTEQGPRVLTALPGEPHALPGEPHALPVDRLVDGTA